MHLSMHAQAARGRSRASTGLSWLCRVASAADRQERACPCDNSNKVSISDRIWRPPVSGIWKPMPAPARKPGPAFVITNFFWFNMCQGVKKTEKSRHW